VELENVNVMGKIIICGGGEAEAGKQSVLLRNVTAGALELDSLTEQFLSIQAEGLTNIGEVTLRTPGYLEDRTEDGLGFQTIRLDGVAGSLFQLAGNIKRVVNLTPESTLQLAQGVADVITMDEKAVDAKLTIDDRASIRELNLDLATQVDGKGSISHLNINAPGSKVTMLPDTIYIRPGITGNVYNQNMDNIAAAESSEDPRLLAGYPKVKDIASTSATAVFSTNKPGTIRWAITALMDGSVGEEDLVNPGSNAKILRSGTLRATASNTEITTRLTGLTKQGSYYVSALLEDARGRRSPVKIAAFTTPDDSAPNFVSGYPQTPILTLDADKEQVAQIMVMATKDCQMYYALFPKGSTAPTAADFRSAALPGNLGYGIVTLRKNAPFLLSRINTSHLQEQTQYDLYLWLNDADNGKSSAVKKVTFTTKDMTPPNILKLEAQSSTDRSVTLSFELSEPGALYWFVTKQGQSVGINKENPTLQNQIMIESAGADGTKIIRRGGPVRFSRTAISFTVTGLEGETTYDLYYMAKDTAGNYCVYNKAIEFPLPIKTRDVNGPKVEVNYSHSNPGPTEDAPPVPRVDTDLRLEFSEIIRGRHDNSADPESILELYRKVETSSGQEKERAKSAWGRALHGYVRLYPGTPPTRGEPTADEVAFSDGAAILPNPDDLPAWIDYREARVEEAGGKTTIVFPGSNSKNTQNGIAPALKLQSGASYYFRIQDIEDTSDNPMKSPPPNVVFTPKFTMDYATIHLVWDQDTIDIPLPDGTTKAARVFTMTPEGTEAVPSGTRWDMLIWTEYAMKYDLYIRALGSSTWQRLNSANANPNSRSPRVFNSVNGNFLQELIGTGLVGTPEAGGYPLLEDFTQPLEVAIVPENTSFTTDVFWDIQVYAGTKAAIGSIARPQGDQKTLDGKSVTVINEPIPYLHIPYEAPLVTPEVWVAEDDATIQSNITDIGVRVKIPGTVYYLAIPLKNVQPGATGSNYTMSEEMAPYVNGVKPNLEDIPTAGVDRDPMMLDSSAVNVYAIATENPQLGSPNTTKYGNTEDRLMGTTRGDMLNIRDLAAETTYLLYLVPTDKENNPAPKVACYKFTTDLALPPLIKVTPSGTTAATIEITPKSKLSYILVNSNYFNASRYPNLIFNQPFTGAYTQGGFKPLPDGWEGTVLDAMLDDYEYQGRTYSVFDMCSNPKTKQDVAGNITGYVGVFVNPTPPHFLLESSNVTNTGLIPFNKMIGSNNYTLLVLAEDENVPAEKLHQRYGLRAHQTYRNDTSKYLYVIDAGLSGESITENTVFSYSGDLWIMFSDAIHYSYKSQNDEEVFKVDSCYMDSPIKHDPFTDKLHLSSNKYLRFDDIMNTPVLNLKLPKPGTHEQLLSSTLTFSTAQPIIAGQDGQLLISFNERICDSDGGVRETEDPLIIKLYRTPIPNTTQVRWEVKVDPVISSSWTSATG
jgi:hypothetical protein